MLNTSLNGAELVVSTSRWRSYVILKNGEFEGFAWDLWRYLAELGNFTYRVVVTKPLDKFFDESGEWSGELGLLQKDEANVSVNSWAVSYHRMEFFDYVRPLFNHEPMRLIFLDQPSSEESLEQQRLWNFFHVLAMFSATIWFAVLSLAAVFIHLILTSNSIRKGVSTYTEMTLDSVLDVLEVLHRMLSAQHGDPFDTGKTRVSRYLLFVWSVFSLFLIAFFYATLTPVFTVQGGWTPPFYDLKTMYHSGFTWMWHNRSASKVEMHNILNKLQQENSEDAFYLNQILRRSWVFQSHIQIGRERKKIRQNLRYHQPKYVFEDNLFYQQNRHCSAHAMSILINTRDLSINWPYEAGSGMMIKKDNHHLLYPLSLLSLHAAEFGILHRLDRIRIWTSTFRNGVFRYRNMILCSFRFRSRFRARKYDSFTGIIDMASIFWIWLLGSIISVTTIALERVFVAKYGVEKNVRIKQRPESDAERFAKAETIEERKMIVLQHVEKIRNFVKMY